MKLYFEPKPIFLTGYQCPNDDYEHYLYRMNLKFMIIRVLHRAKMVAVTKMELKKREYATRRRDNSIHSISALSTHSIWVAWLLCCFQSVLCMVLLEQLKDKLHISYYLKNITVPIRVKGLEKWLWYSLRVRVRVVSANHSVDTEINVSSIYLLMWNATVPQLCCIYRYIPAAAFFYSF